MLAARLFKKTQSLMTVSSTTSASSKQLTIQSSFMNFATKTQTPAQKEKAKQAAQKEKEKKQLAAQKEKEKNAAAKEKERLQKEAQKNKEKKEKEAKLAKEQKEKQHEKEKREKERQAKIAQANKEKQQKEKEKAKIKKTKEEEERKLQVAKVKAEREAEKSKPKRALSPYTFFTKQMMPTFRTQNPKMEVKDIMKLLGKEWKEISESAKKQYVDLAEKDKARSVADREAYKKSLGPKRPLSAFLLFSNSIRAKLVEELGTKDIAKVSKTAGERWQALPEAERKPFETEAQNAKEKYQKLTQKA